VHVSGCPSLAGRFWLSHRLFQRFLAGRFEVATTLANNEPLTPRVIVKCCGLAGHDQAASLGSFSVD
jgi:hypothetical protein